MVEIINFFEESIVVEAVIIVSLEWEGRGGVGRIHVREVSFGGEAIILGGY